MGTQSNQHVPQSNQSGPNGVPTGTSIDPTCHQNKLKDLQKHTMRVEIEKVTEKGVPLSAFRLYLCVRKPIKVKSKTPLNNM